MVAASEVRGLEERVREERLLGSASPPALALLLSDQKFLVHWAAIEAAH
jgi:hypothetical protein